MSEWIKFKDKEPDMNRIHFITDGETMLIRGESFLFHMIGPQKSLGEMEFKYFSYIPEFPGENE